MVYLKVHFESIFFLSVAYVFGDLSGEDTKSICFPTLFFSSTLLPYLVILKDKVTHLIFAFTGASFQKPVQ